ncbi:MAG: hypothetical protein LUE92_02640 [Clostridiales bacterium]|nr:hypothetical protein [Clostridiales bacterium]
MKGKIQTISTSELINYFENPRHSIGNSERDTLEKLFNAVGTQYMLNLAEDIKNNGLLGNQYIVVVYSEEAKKYIVYEGNRRVAAIKLLMNPQEFDFLDKASYDKAKKISEGAEVIDSLECYVTSEEDAFFIMERVHSGEDKGRGTKEWGAREKDTFQVRRNNTKNLSYLIDCYVRNYCDGLDITTILSFTTIQRIFNNRKVRTKIGLNVLDENTFTADRMKLVVEAAKWIVNESETAGVAVTRLFNKAQMIESKLLPWIEEYLERSGIENTQEREKTAEINPVGGDDHLTDVSQNTQKNTDQKENNNSKSDSGIDSTANNESKDENNETPKKEDGVASGKTPSGAGSKKNLPYFFQGLDYSALNPQDVDSHGVSAVCRELQLFSNRRLVDSYPIASTFLIRAVIEQSIIYYSKKHKIQAQDKYIWEDIKNLSKLSKIIDKYIKNLANYIADSEMKQYFMALFGNYEQTVDPLNWVIHRPTEYRLGSQALLDLPGKGLLALINYMLS